MMYFDFEAGNNAYKLRLNTRNVVSLEQKIGCNPLGIFGSRGDRIPTITEMVNILHASLQPFHHGVTVDKAYDIFDAWIADGHQVTDFINIIVQIYKASGIIKSDDESGEEEKN